MRLGAAPRSMQTLRRILLSPWTLSARQAEGNQLGAVIPASDRYDDILHPTQHIGHRRAGLRRGHINSTSFLAGLLIVSPQHRATRATRRGEYATFPAYHQRLGDGRT